MTKRINAKTDPIDISDMELNELNFMVNKQLESWLKECPPWISLPAIWGESDGWNGPPPKDPLTLYICLPLTGDDSHTPRWSVSLVQVLEDFLRETREDTSYAAQVLVIANALEALVKRMRAACATGERNLRRGDIAISPIDNREDK